LTRNSGEYSYSALNWAASLTVPNSVVLNSPFGCVSQRSESYMPTWLTTARIDCGCCVSAAPIVRPPLLPPMIASRSALVYLNSVR
jgi:hypothetical protein